MSSGSPRRAIQLLGLQSITFDGLGGSGAARIERGRDGRWRVADSVWHPQEGSSYNEKPGSDDPGLENGAGPKTGDQVS
jgi:hypothetical protein